MDVVVHTLEQYLETNASKLDEVWVGYSGGLDSHVLLHALCKLQNKFAISVSAIHINHQLQPEADDWAQHCQSQCENLGIPCQVLVVDAKPESRQSPEDAARIARYRAIRDFIPANATFLTAHHQTDQAETILLQLMRGSGIAGLAAMPESRVIDGVKHDRPLLHCPQQDMLAYAEKQQLAWIEDPTNTDVSVRRNYIRHEVLPTFKKQWQATDELLARSARYLADALRLQNNFLDNLLPDLLVTPDCMNIDKLGKLPEVQQGHFIRHWYHSLGLARPPESLVKQIFEEVISTRDDAQPKLCFAGSQLLKAKNNLLLLPDWSTPASERIEVNDSMTIERDAFLLSLDFSVSMTDKQFFCQVGDYSASIDLRGQPRALKKFYKELGLPVTLRTVLPLVFCDDLLVLIPGLYTHESLSGLSYSFELKRFATSSEDFIAEIFL